MERLLPEKPAIPEPQKAIVSIVVFDGKATVPRYLVFSKQLSGIVATPASMVRPTSLEPENALLPTEQPERKTKSVMPEFTNALAPTEASPDGVPGENGLLQPLNALIPMEVSPSGNVMSVSAAHPWNA